MRSEQEGPAQESPAQESTVPADKIYRCSAGHLYSADPVRATWNSIHLGPGRHFQRCPVDRRWRMAYLVHPEELTGEQLEEARKHQF
jgi:hypothetical protein